MRSLDTDRLRSILQMLKSISEGDFNYRISRSKEDDYIEAIVVYLNMMAEEMYETLTFYSSLHVVDGKRHQLQLLFILNHDYKIRYVTAGVQQQLGFEASSLIGTSFSSLVAKSHLEQWRALGRTMLLTKEYTQQHPFLLLREDGLERNYLCGFTSIFDVETSSQFIIVSISEPVVQSKILEDVPRSNIYISHEHAEGASSTPYVLRNKKDVQTLFEIKQYILKHIDAPLPSLKELAHEFGINEFKLKTGFKQLYGETVFRYLKLERLEKGHLLLSSTNFTLKEISKMCGYKSTTHFVRNFREHYGMPPKTFRDQTFKKKLRK
tara:strand:+ start:12434 stop:13402 length:969 start_codon:yes stop_codon:yes gene_type:complete